MPNPCEILAALCPRDEREFRIDWLRRGADLDDDRCDEDGWDPSFELWDMVLDGGCLVERIDLDDREECRWCDDDRLLPGRPRCGLRVIPSSEDMDTSSSSPSSAAKESKSSSSSSS